LPAHSLTLSGTVRRIDTAHNLFTLLDAEGTPHIIHLDDAFIFLTGDRTGAPEDLRRGMQVEVRGREKDDDSLDARAIRILSAAPAPVIAAATEEAGLIHIYGVVDATDVAHVRAFVSDGDGRRYRVDYADADLSRNDGRPSPMFVLLRGMPVQITGERRNGDTIVARQVVVGLRHRPAFVHAVRRSEPAPPPVTVTRPAAPPIVLDQDSDAADQVPSSAPATANRIPESPDPAAVLADIDSYTGLVIDVRHLSQISRSPAPAIYGPDNILLYPDRAHVPTPDQVQEASVVRYYHSEPEALSGIVGSHPLILPAQAVLGPAKDSILLSADDMSLLQALETHLHITRNWKVGFLIPDGK